MRINNRKGVKKDPLGSPILCGRCNGRMNNDGNIICNDSHNKPLLVALQVHPLTSSPKLFLQFFFISQQKCISMCATKAFHELLKVNCVRTNISISKYYLLESFFFFIKQGNQQLELGWYSCDTGSRDPFPLPLYPQVPHTRRKTWDTGKPGWDLISWPPIYNK